MSEELPQEIREATEADIPFVIDSWVKVYRATRIAAPIPADIYKRWQRKRVIEILKISKVTISSFVEDKNHILGFAVARKIGGVGILSWIFVKYPYRGFGIGKKLYDHVGPVDIVTHIGADFQAKRNPDGTMTECLPNGLVYNPFLDQLPVDIGDVSKTTSLKGIL